MKTVIVLVAVAVLSLAMPLPPASLRARVVDSRGNPLHGGLLVTGDGNYTVGSDGWVSVPGNTPIYAYHAPQPLEGFFNASLEHGGDGFRIVVEAVLVEAGGTGWRIEGLEPPGVPGLVNASLELVECPVLRGRYRAVLYLEFSDPVDAVRLLGGDIVGRGSFIGAPSAVEGRGNRWEVLIPSPQCTLNMNLGPGENYTAIIEAEYGGRSWIYLLTGTLKPGGGGGGAVHGSSPANPSPGGTPTGWEEPVKPGRRVLEVEKVLGAVSMLLSAAAILLVLRGSGHHRLSPR